MRKLYVSHCGASNSLAGRLAGWEVGLLAIENAIRWGGPVKQSLVAAAHAARVPVGQGSSSFISIQMGASILNCSRSFSISSQSAAVVG